MATKININKVIKDISNYYMVSYIIDTLNKTGIKMYYYLNDQADKSQVTISYSNLEEYNITKRQYQLGLEDLKEAGYIKPVDDSSDTYVFTNCLNGLEILEEDKSIL